MSDVDLLRILVSLVLYSCSIRVLSETGDYSARTACFKFPAVIAMSCTS